MSFHRDYDRHSPMFVNQVNKSLVEQRPHSLQWLVGPKRIPHTTRSKVICLEATLSKEFNCLQIEEHSNYETNFHTSKNYHSIVQLKCVESSVYLETSGSG